ncbi:potassium transporter KefB [Mucilaginibacter aquatilis]|uniref:Potassium transporter KefB n=1 Tax=Mucilaginibacter aquatilis TaxID=1517760 RepID=A0A6I4I9B1_9SPHI|nr:potassium transporter KefB [Mucilaginibacter aquatilis]MVN91612.1 potassium transporter KefB [Mucilaginibacter aquatilis]
MSHQITAIPQNSSSLKLRMLIGGSVALVLIAIFLLPVKNVRPEWGQFWMVRPFIIVPLAGATGGAVSYYLTKLLPQSGWVKVATVLLSLLIYIIGLWLGTVLGLAGTLWD